MFSVTNELTTSVKWEVGYLTVSFEFFVDFLSLLTSSA